MFCAALQCCDGEATGVAESVQNGAVFGKFAHQIAVETLVKEESRFLSFFPVDQELRVVFEHEVFALAAKEIAVFNAFFSHALHCLGTLVVDSFDFQLRNGFQCLCYRVDIQRHAFGLRLDDGGFAINVNNQSWEVVAFRMYKSKAVGVRIVNESKGFACLESGVEALLPEHSSDFGVFKRKQLHGDVTGFAEASAENLVFGVCDCNNITGLQSGSGLSDST